MSHHSKPSPFKAFKTVVRESLEKIGLSPVRSDFLKILPKNGVGAELGVFQGQFSQDLIKITKPKKIYLIDPWWKVCGEHYGDWSRHHNNGELLPTKKAYQQAVDNVAQVDNNKVAEFFIDDDVEVLKKMEDNSLDWAYVDSTHTYEPTVMELEQLERVVRPDGIISGHDWRPDPKHHHHGVYKAVNEFCEKYNWGILKIDAQYTQWAIKRNK